MKKTEGSLVERCSHQFFKTALLFFFLFLISMWTYAEGFKGDNISDYEGLSKTHPMAAALMLIFMFSLTGIPPTAGFMGKFYIFMSAINAWYNWLQVS